MFFLYNSFISLIRMSIKMHLLFIDIKYNKLIINFLKILIIKGYLKGYTINNTKIRIYFKYIQNKSVLNNILQVSGIKKKNFKSVLSIKKLTNNGWDYIFSTPRGLLTQYECIIYKQGGLLLCKIN